MSDPILVQDKFVWFVCDENPGPSEPVIDQNGIHTDPNWLFPWWNQTTNDIFWCVNNAIGEMQWKRILLSDVDAAGVGAPLALENGGTSATDAASARSALGLNINSPRAYKASNISKFGEPSIAASNDLFVIVTVRMRNSSDSASTISADIDSGEGYQVIASVEMSEISATLTQTLSFIVPTKATYRISDNGKGENTLVSVYELTL